MQRVTGDSARFASVGSLTSLLAVATCYGTLALVAGLSLLGVAVEVNEGWFVKVITGLLLLAVGGMLYSYRVHRVVGPLLLTVAAASILGWVFYGEYSKPLELAGFGGLVAASLWDFRAKKRACSPKGAKETNA